VKVVFHSVFIGRIKVYGEALCFIGKSFEKVKLFHFLYMMIENMPNKTKGRISYLKAMTSDVRKVFAGRRIGSLDHFIVYPGTMSDFQVSTGSPAT